MSSRDRRGTRTLLCLALASPATSMSEAQTTIALDASSKAASNPLLQTGGNTAAMVFEISVLPELKHVDARGNTIDLAAVVTVRDYSRRYPRYILGSVAATREFRQSERLSGTVSLGVTRDLAADTPALGIDALVAPQSVRTTLSGAGQIEWRPDVLTMITPAISALRSTYDRTALLRETRSGQASVGYARTISEMTRIGMRPLFAVSHTPGEPTLQRYAIYGTVQHHFSSVLEIDFDLGVEHVPHADDVGLNRRSPPGATSLTGALRLCRKTSRLDACLTAELGSQVSAIEGFQRSKSVRTTASYRLDERKTVTVQLDYQRAAAVVGLHPQGELEAGAASVTLDWRLTATVTVSGVAGYSLRQADAVSRPNSTYVGLRLRLEPRVR